MIIGVPKEIMHDEYRVAAIPETVKKFVADGPYPEGQGTALQRKVRRPRDRHDEERPVPHHLHPSGVPGQP